MTSAGLNACIEGLDGEYPETIWFYPAQGEPERCGYVRMDRYTDLLRALGQARRLVDAVKAQAGVADPALLAKTDHAIRTALSEVYAKVFAAGATH
jgi:hypothetical protein